MGNAQALATAFVAGVAAIGRHSTFLGGNLGTRSAWLIQYFDRAGLLTGWGATMLSTLRQSEKSPLDAQKKVLF